MWYILYGRTLDHFCSKQDVKAIFLLGLQNSVSPNLSPVDMASLAAAMRMGNNGDMSGSTQGSTGPQQQGVQTSGPEQALRMQEALLRSQAEAALRLAVRKKSNSSYRLSVINFSHENTHDSIHLQSSF